jgi:two-component system C4-dicarboxylate transport response regulator DctD
MVCVIDEDARVRDTIATLLQSHKFEVQEFSTTDEFLTAADFARNGCLVADVRSLTVSSEELIARLRTEGVEWPVILMANGMSLGSAVAALRAGAFDVIEKPFVEHTLLNTVVRALPRKQSSNGRSR